MEVKNEEVNAIIDALSRDFETREVEKISKSWIKAVMSQPSRNKSKDDPKNKTKTKIIKERRSFEYSLKKFRKYLQWRIDSDITNKIEYHLNNHNHGGDGGGERKLNVTVDTDSDTDTVGSTSPSSSSCDENENENGKQTITKSKRKTNTNTTIKLISTTSPGSFYWYGVDNDGAPVLWYKANLTQFDKTNVKNEIEYASLILHGVLDALPPQGPIHDLNFVILFDDYNPVKAMSRPTMAPEFIKMLMVTCPDRLKRAVMVTGTVGNVFYNVAKGIAPSNIIDKVVVTKSRVKAARLIVEQGIVSSKEFVPDFMGGTYVHDEHRTVNYSAMIKAMRLTMA